VGLGGIGREVAWRVRALGMNVVAVRRGRRAEELAGSGSGAKEEGAFEVLRGDGGLRALLSRSDYVVIAVPSTRETRGMIGAGELAAMRRDAVLINVARGDVVDEDALVEALRGGRLRGAALDVFREEPLPSGSPLWGLPNVLITPHVSGTTDRFWTRETELITENVARYLSGRALRNIVDKSAGY
jgi:phosphoglycerate dehydrogenase-like enzyme